MFVVIKGIQWHAMDSETFRLSTELDGCCETVCDEVDISEPFVTIKSIGRNTIFVQSSDVVLLREYTVDPPPGSAPLQSTDS